jgi:hypothetical protein
VAERFPQKLDFISAAGLELGRCLSHSANQRRNLAPFQNGPGRKPAIPEGILIAFRSAGRRAAVHPATTNQTTSYFLVSGGRLQRLLGKAHRPGGQPGVSAYCPVFISA